MLKVDVRRVASASTNTGMDSRCVDQNVRIIHLYERENKWRWTFHIPLQVCACRCNAFGAGLWEQASCFQLESLVGSSKLVAQKSASLKKVSNDEGLSLHRKMTTYPLLLHAGLLR